MSEQTAQQTEEKVEVTPMIAEDEEAVRIENENLFERQNVGEVQSLYPEQQSEAIQRQTNVASMPLTQFIRPSEMSDSNSSGSEDSDESEADVPLPANVSSRDRWQKTTSGSDSSDDDKDSEEERTIVEQDAAMIDEMCEAEAIKTYIDFEKIYDNIIEAHKSEQIPATRYTHNELMETLIEREKKAKLSQEKIKRQITKTRAFRKNITTIKEDWTSRKLQQEITTVVSEMVDEKYIDKVMEKYHDISGYNLEYAIRQWEELALLYTTQVDENTGAEIEQVLINVGKAHRINCRLPLKLRIDVDMHYLNILGDIAPDITASHEEIHALGISYNLKKKVMKLHLNLAITQSTSVKQQSQNTYEVDTEGAVKIVENKLLILDSTNNAVSTTSISAVNMELVTNPEPSDDYIRQLLSLSRMLILDYDNMVKAMKMTDDDIKAWCKYMSEWGITTVMPMKEKSAVDVGSTINILVDSEEHDDIALLVVGRINRALIMSKDRFSEFSATYTICSEHKTIQVRTNETCQYSYTGKCTYVTLNYKEVGRTFIENVQTANGHVIKFNAPLSIKRSLKTSNRDKMVPYRARYPTREHSALEHHWSINALLKTGPMPVRSRRTSTRSISLTTMQLNMSSAARCVVSDNTSLVMCTVIDEMETKDILQIKSKITGTLMIKNGVIVLTNKQGVMLGTNEEPPIDANIYNSTGVKVISKLFKSAVQISGIRNVSVINTMSKLNQGWISLVEASVHTTQNMLDQSIVLVVSKGIYRIVKVTPELVTFIQQSAIDYVASKVQSAPNAMHVLPLTTYTKMRMTQQFETETATEIEGISNASSILVDNQYMGLNTYFKYIDPDKPSRQLFTAPESTTFVMATIGFENRAEDIPDQSFEIVGDITQPEYVSMAEAMAIYTSWQDMDVQRKDITIDYYVWEDAALKSNNCSKRDVENIRMAMHQSLEQIVRDVTKDTMTIFKAICQGYKIVSLPPLVRAHKVPWLKLSKPGKPIKLQIIWSLPICSVTERMIIRHGSVESVASALVCISPPITHNYIAAIQGHSLTLENEYSVEITRRAEMAIMEFLGIAMSVMSTNIDLLYMSYGTFALGLQMMGIDATQTVLNSIPALTSGSMSMDQVLTVTEIKTQMIRVPIEKYILGTARGRMDLIYEKRYRNGLWDKPRDTHMAIHAVAQLADDTYENFSVGYTIAMVLVGSDNISRHLSQCYKASINFEKLKVHEVKEKLSKNVVKLLSSRVYCCLREMVRRPDMSGHSIKYATKTTLKIEQNDRIVHVEPYRPQRAMIKQLPSDYSSMVNALPMEGRIQLLMIHSSNKSINRITRLKNVLKEYDKIQQVNVVTTTIHVKHASVIPLEITRHIRIARRNNRLLMVHAYDKAGTHLKKVPQKDRHKIILRKDTVCYIPDMLLFNTLKYETIEMEETEEQIDITKDMATDTDEAMNLKQPSRLSTVTTAASTSLAVKVVLLALAVLALAYFWPFTMQFVLLPSMLYAYVFPLKMVPVSTVSWFGKLLGRAPVMGFAKVSWIARAFPMALNFVWWVVLLVLTARLLLWMFPSLRN